MLAWKHTVWWNIVKFYGILKPKKVTLILPGSRKKYCSTDAELESVEGTATFSTDQAFLAKLGIHIP